MCKRPVSPALLNPLPRGETIDLRALHKVEVKVDAGRNDRGDHGARAPAALEPRDEADGCRGEPGAWRLCEGGGGTARHLSKPGVQLAAPGSRRSAVAVRFAGLRAGAADRTIAIMSRCSTGRCGQNAGPVPDRSGAPSFPSTRPCGSSLQRTSSGQHDNPRQVPKMRKVKLRCDTDREWGRRN
jgi:hypothetical protein